MITETLSGSTLVYATHELQTPMTITLESTAVGRKIELSTDNGTNFWEPIVDITVTNCIVVAIASPISHIKVTGEQGDKFHLLYSKED